MNSAAAMYMLATDQNHKFGSMNWPDASRVERIYSEQKLPRRFTMNKICMYTFSAK